MGVEYMLVDHKRREYFDLGKSFGQDAFEIFEHGKMLDSNGEHCYGYGIRRPSSAAELEGWLREEVADEYNGTSWWKGHAIELAKIAERIFAFLSERPDACCVHADCSWDAENYIQVGSRYYDSDSACAGCREGAAKVYSEKYDPLTSHEHFRVVLDKDETCNDCGERYSEHPLADEYLVIDRYTFEEEGHDPAYGPFLRRLCNRELVKWDVLPEMDEDKYPRAAPPPSTGPKMRRSMLGFPLIEIAPGETVEVSITVGLPLFRADRFISVPEVAEALTVDVTTATFKAGDKITLKVRNPTDKPIKWTGALLGTERS